MNQNLKTGRITGAQSARLTSHPPGPPLEGTPSFNPGKTPGDGGHHFHDDDMFDGDDEGECPKNKRGHRFVCQEGFDIIGEGRSYCEWCGADGDA